MVFRSESIWIGGNFLIVGKLLLNRLDFHGEFNVINFILIDRFSKLSKRVLLALRYVLSYLGFSKSLSLSRLDDSWNFNNFFNFDYLINFYILRNLDVFLNWNFDSYFNDSLNRNLYYFLSIDRFLYNPFNLYYSIYNLFNRNLNELFLDDFNFDFSLYNNRNFDYSLYRNFDLNIFINIYLNIFGHFDFSDHSPLIGNLHLLYNINILIDISFNRYFYYPIHKDRNIDILMNYFLNVFLDWMRNIDSFLYWNLFYLINIDLFVYIFDNWNLMVSFYDLL